ncbi:hypothetical protein GCM10020295_58590 [Streptomyces cinereospinus]
METCKLSTDSQFVAKVRDVVGIYLSPPESALVLAVDETEPVKKWLLRPPASTCTSPPTSASWLSLVEGWFARLTRREVRRTAHRSVAELERTSATGPTSGTRTPCRSSGQRPPTTPLPRTAHEVTTQDTS